VGQVQSLPDHAAQPQTRNRPARAQAVERGRKVRREGIHDARRQADHLAPVEAAGHDASETMDMKSRCNEGHLAAHVLPVESRDERLSCWREGLGDEGEHRTSGVVIHRHTTAA
jgi:hypothetical protein